jgi:uncharacterized lipoprotein YbaY/heat shock protein HslJ
MRQLAGLLTWAVALAIFGPACAVTSQITGTASYRERIALPPGAVFDAILEDVSVAEAPAIELGRATIADPGAPPLSFEIDYQTEDILPDRTYAVRGQVTVGPRLMFVTDTMTPVLTHGAPDRVELWMIKIGETAQETRAAPETIGAHGLRLPASFTGDLPCPKCLALRFRLNLWPDQVFHMRRSWIGADRREDTIGRWSIDPHSRVLTLRGAAESWEFRIRGTDHLQPLPQGNTGDVDASAMLSMAPEVQPFDPHLPLRGMLTYVGDDARFTECLTGRDYPLVRDGDYDALEHAYLAAGAEAGGPIMASFDGGIIGVPGGADPNAGPAVMVERFVGVWPEESCERAVDKASLTNTYWKILRLGDAVVSALEGRREPNLFLREGEPRFTATVGCNQLAGSYALDEDKLAFGLAAATRMACPPPLDAWERKLADVVTAAAGWRIDGQTLELLDAEGTPLALLQAGYLF